MLLQEVFLKFSTLPPDRLQHVVESFWLSPEAVDHTPFGPVSQPRLTALNYFFVQTPHRLFDQSGAQPLQISYSDAMCRIREVHYDRDTIVNAMDIEAKEMADGRMRYDSFNKSEHLKSKVLSYQLSQLGFFFVGDCNSPGKLRCSFCRRTIHIFKTEEIPHLEKEWDRWLLTLLQRHAHLSATCPFSYGLNGDDKCLSSDDIARVIDALIPKQAIQDALLNISPQIDSSILRISAASIISQCSNGLPPLDGDMSNAYNNVIAELDYELYTPFETKLEIENELNTIDDLAPHSTPIDYFVGAEPKYKNYMTLLSRIGSFDVEAWRQHSISKSDSLLLKPDSFAKAGFYYSGTTDNMMCFCCGLGLHHWEATDDPITEHVKFAPRCTWLLRLLGRQRVKYVYMKTNETQAGGLATAQQKLTDSMFIRDVDDIAGIRGTEDILVFYSNIIQAIRIVLIKLSYLKFYMYSTEYSILLLRPPVLWGVFYKQGTVL